MLQLYSTTTIIIGAISNVENSPRHYNGDENNGTMDTDDDSNRLIVKQRWDRNYLKTVSSD